MKIFGRPEGPIQANCYLVYDEEMKKAFLVDPGAFDPKFREIIDGKELELVYIILTHGHSDHLAGVPEYKLIYPDAKVICSEDEVPMITHPEANFAGFDTDTPAITPDITVKEGDLITVGNMSFKVLETPGHTPGGMCLVGGGVCFSGDTLFRDSIGRTDFPGGSYEQIIDSIQRKLFELPDDTRVFPGHMGETTIGHEKKYNPFF